MTSETLRPSDVYGALAALGLSEQSISVFARVQSEDELMEALGGVDQHIGELALELYETKGVVPDRTKYTLYSDDADLESALRGALRDWGVYLHPSQRFIVELPAEFRVAVSGSAGTGKTVCAWHRIQTLATHGVSVGFVCPDQNALSVSRARIEDLLRDGKGTTYYFVPRSSDELVEL